MMWKNEYKRVHFSLVNKKFKEELKTYLKNKKCYKKKDLIKIRESSEESQSLDVMFGILTDKRFTYLKSMVLLS